MLPKVFYGLGNLYSNFNGYIGQGPDCAKASSGPAAAFYRWVGTREEHHKTRSCIEEYEAVLKKFEIDYDEQIVFKPFDYQVPDGTSWKFIYPFYQDWRP